jgi:hypothetical protein
MRLASANSTLLVFSDGMLESPNSCYIILPSVRELGASVGTLTTPSFSQIGPDVMPPSLPAEPRHPARRPPGADAHDRLPQAPRGRIGSRVALEPVPPGLPAEARFYAEHLLGAKAVHSDGRQRGDRKRAPLVPVAHCDDRGGSPGRG